MKSRPPHYENEKPFAHDIKIRIMELEEPVLKILRKKYQPSSFIETHCNCYDMAFKTDREGDAIVLVLGRKDDSGQIKGERFTRRLRQMSNGRIVKEYWEHKGKAS
jgi:hypothetical protein